MSGYNVLIIGAGRIGAFFDSPEAEKVLSHGGGFYRQREFNIVGFVDTDFEAAQKASEIWGGRGFSSIDEAFEHCRIDVVSVTVPDEFHYSTVEAIIGKGVQLIILEKPIATTLEEGDKLLSLIEGDGSEVIVNYTRRFVPEIRALKTLIQDGDYGGFVNGTGHYGKGVLHNGSHMIDLIRYLLGEVKSFSNYASKYDYYEDDPTVSSLLHLDNGGTFNMCGTNSKNFTIFEMDLMFEKGRIRIIDSGFDVEMYKVEGSDVFEGYKYLKLDKHIKTDLINNMKYVVEHALDVLENNSRNISTVYEGYRNLELCLEMKKI